MITAPVIDSLGLASTLGFRTHGPDPSDRRRRVVERTFHPAQEDTQAIVRWFSLSPVRHPEASRSLFASYTCSGHLAGAHSVLMTRCGAAYRRIAFTKRAIRSLMFEIEMVYLIHGW